MPQVDRFPILILVSLIVFLAILRFVLRRRVRERQPSLLAVLIVALIVNVGGMAFAKVGNNLDWPAWIYYGAPAALTWLLPALAFRLSRGEFWQYLLLIFLSAPTIHIAFSFFLGWHDYMPFIPVPSWHDLISR